eukprot:CAMPEP_0194036346 /NCGR_PEP_ID=MMETSP0009_2-20130614/8685_1 /TAXON_ID=210454 /ORGANISM="Grammatophora oceanica, Strain CCMP 410" /LENGTH=637 /DNA_ID=CAMNT_0038678049 /DNA_START=96 /DNA_END=2009 /DNA_ORIENTATION=+
MVASSRRNSDAGTASPSSSLSLSREVAAGVVNMGNTCYMSAVLSALAHAPELCNAMDAEPHAVSCRTARKKRSSPTPPSPPSSSAGVRRSSRRSSPASSEDGDNFCTLCEVEQHLHRVHASTDGPVAPSVFVHGFIDHVAPPTFKLGVQEDSHEFLRLLIDAMQKSCSRSRPDETPKIKKEVKEEDKENVKKEEEAEDVDKEYPFKLFRGTVDSNVVCDSCLASSSKIDPIEDIGLEVEVNGNTGLLTSLNDSLNRFTQPEPLSGYKCDKCSKTGRATKVSRLASVPPILTLHLKRFRYGTGGGTDGGGRGTRTAAAASGNGGTNNGYSSMTGGNGTSSRRSAGREVSQLLMGSSGSAKIEGHVKYMEILNLKPFLTKTLADQHGTMFSRLFAVIVHAGKNSHSGHYIAFVRNVQKNEWWKMDDARVTPSSSAEVLAAEAYMLFYRVVEHPVAQHYRNAADAARDTAAKQEATDDDDDGCHDADKQVKKEQMPQSRKRRGPPEPHYEDVEEWARLKTRIPPSVRGIFHRAEDCISKRVELPPSFCKLIKEEAERDGKKPLSDSVKSSLDRDELTSYKNLKQSAIRMIYMLAKTIKDSSSETTSVPLIKALLGDAPATDGTRDTDAPPPMVVESDNVL